MVRRWSYLASNKVKHSSIKIKLKPVLIKKGFKNTVRFRRNYSSLSKIFKKRYSFRKIKNSSFTLVTNSFSWAKFYLSSTFYEKRSQFREVLPFNPNLTQSIIRAQMLSSAEHSSTKFINFNLKSKKLASLVKISSSSIFFSSKVNYTFLLNLNWGTSVAFRSYNLLLAQRKIIVLALLLQLFKNHVII